VPAAWWAAAAAAALYFGLVASGRNGLLKVLPPSLLAAACFPVSPAIAAALVFCAVGDAFLLDKDRYFLHGLAAFLVGHLLFIPGLWARATTGVSPVAAALVGIAFLAVLATVVPRLSPRLRVAVPLYAVALSGMLIAAFGVSPLAAVGAVLFAISDSLIAVNRFVRPLPAAEVLVSATYEGALLLITAAVLVPPG
jgi:uncharacterized membrane protein YhhN